MLMQQSMRHRKFHGVLFTYLGMFTQDQEKMWEHESHADDVKMRQTDKSQWMTSQMSHTKQSDKSIGQLNCMG